jgi:ABC-type nickel/cobalt efflux system permease component RcnA
VLVFALTQGLFWAGVASAFAMAIGTAITVSALAVMAVGSRDLAVRLSGGSSLWRDRIEGTAAIAGSLFILFIGLSLFFGSLGPSQPFVF